MLVWPAELTELMVDWTLSDRYQRPTPYHPADYGAFIGAVHSGWVRRWDWSSAIEKEFNVAVGGPALVAFVRRYAT